VAAAAKLLATNRVPVSVAAVVPVAPVRYVAQVAEINALEPSLRALTDAELAEQTLRFKAALERNRHRWGAAAGGALTSSRLHSSPQPNGHGSACAVQMLLQHQQQQGLRSSPGCVSEDTLRLVSLCRLSAALDELLPEAFATVREASRRVLGMRHFDSQLVGEFGSSSCNWAAAAAATQH
jgi:hypothetical protein